VPNISSVRLTRNRYGCLGLGSDTDRSAEGVTMDNVIQHMVIVSALALSAYFEFSANSFLGSSTNMILVGLCLGAIFAYAKSYMLDNPKQTIQSESLSRAMPDTPARSNPIVVPDLPVMQKQVVQPPLLHVETPQDIAAKLEQMKQMSQSSKPFEAFKK
jgi:hypothetical protein